MSVVVDSSVVVAALLDSGPNGVWAEKVIEDRALYAPELVPPGRGGHPGASSCHRSGARLSLIPAL